MSKINIKIVNVDPASHTLLVKYASDNSAKSIDDYDAVVFQLTDSTVLSPEQFIESIKSQISYHVTMRDAVESLSGTIDIATWNGFATVVESTPLVASAPAVIDALATPEIVL